MAGRITSASGEAPEPLTVIIDGQPYEAYAGETVAAALYASGRRAWRKSRGGQPRGLLCGMGVCFDCLVTVDETPGLRACQTLVADGMRIVVEVSEDPS